MTMTTADARRFLAEEIRVTCNVRSPRLVEALASIPRERFLPPGPWLIRGMYDQASRQTDDDDPRHVYHDVAIGIDPGRNLYNGQPSLIAKWLEGLTIKEGERVLHIGCGTGYFSALIAHMVGPRGQVLSVDVDANLAARARENLAEWPWAQAAVGDGRSALPSDVDVVLVHAGATHLLDEWLDALREGGRLLVPLTGTVPGMPAGIGKGVVLNAQRNGETWSARVGSMVAIYSLVGLRDETMSTRLGDALRTSKWTTVTRLRRDAHEAGATCFLHGETNCLSG
jgi:protein-L-isoaspartate(D-aspartate) O-methyltransferase